jgi:uncharacterized protein YodC (DUF2158 family)
MSTFSEGQIVELKSGGPQMVVKSVDGSEATCIWFFGDKPVEKSFQLKTLDSYSLPSIVRPAVGKT